MNKQKTHAYFRHPIIQQFQSPRVSNLVSTKSHDRFKESAKQSGINQSRGEQSDIMEKSMTRSGLFLVDKGAGHRRNKKDKEIQKLYTQLQNSKIKIRQLEERDREYMLLKKQNDMFRVELQKIQEQIRTYSKQQNVKVVNLNTRRDSNQLMELSNNYQTLKQINMENIKLIEQLKFEINKLNSQNVKLKNEIMNQRTLMERVNLLENTIRKLEVEIINDSKQWEVQKQSFVQILHAEIQGAKRSK